MRILGISAYYHDSAAVLLENDNIVAAAQEERFSRLKHDAAFPAQAIDFCLSSQKLSIHHIDAVVFYESHDLKKSRQLKSFLRAAPYGFRGFRRFGNRLLTEGANPIVDITARLSRLPGSAKWNKRVVPGEHHMSHAASAYYPSKFKEAVILTIDGVGEWDTTTISIGRDNRIEKLASIVFPHSLGLLYSAFTAYCGFKVNDGEYKLMGLAPYGTPIYAERILNNLIDVKEDGSFKLDMSYFDFVAGTRMFSAKFEALLDGPARTSSDIVSQRHMDVAASIQAVLEDVVLKLVRHAVARTGVRNLCLAGGVALNCVANGKILRSGLVDDLWIQPAAGDAGGALGCALQFYYTQTGAVRITRATDSMHGARLGPTYDQKSIESSLTALGAVYTILDDDGVIAAAADALSAGEVVGWFDGRMEFGPRALGGRSILGDPRRADMQRVLNLKVKFRESFRPFAPIVLAERASDWFEISHESPYMLIVAPVLERLRQHVSDKDNARSGFDRLNVARSPIPAVTHVDYSARIQTVDRGRNPRLHKLLSEFATRTGVPLLVNTSFNVNDEPIVCSPEDAFRCFMKTQIDKLVIGNCILDRKSQPADTIARLAGESAPPAQGLAPSDSLYTLY